MSLVRINRNPSARQLAVFGFAWLAFAGIAGWVMWHRGRHGAAEAAWVLSLAVPAAGLVAPAFLKYVYLGLSYATYPIGVAVSFAALALVYYLALAPIGLTMRLFHYDPLARRPDKKAASYWKARGGARPLRDYFSQS